MHEKKWQKKFGQSGKKDLFSLWCGTSAPVPLQVGGKEQETDDDSCGLEDTYWLLRALFLYAQ